MSGTKTIISRVNEFVRRTGVQVNRLVSAVIVLSQSSYFISPGLDNGRKKVMGLITHMGTNKKRHELNMYYVRPLDL